MHRLKAGIIGGGFIGVQHVEAVRRLGYVDVIAIAGASLDRARASADELFIERAYGTYKELLADPDIEVLHNCTPNAESALRDQSRCAGSGQACDLREAAGDELRRDGEPG